MSSQESNPKTKGQWLAAEATVKAKSGSFEEAINLLNEAIDLDPSDFRYFNNRCWCYLKVKQPENAHSDAKEAIKLNPFKWKGYFNRGRALIGLKRYAEAERSFKTAKELSGDDSKHDFAEEIRKVQYLSSIKDYMDPKSEEIKKVPQKDGKSDEFLRKFWNECGLKTSWLIGYCLCNWMWY